MLGKTTHTEQLEIFRPQLKQLLASSHELVHLAKEVDWQWIEESLKDYYAEVGRPSVPIRCIVGMLLLKHIFNESDESVLDRWVENPYWQYFTGEQFFQHEKPFDPSDFPKFRHRIGEQGMEKVLSLSIKLHPGTEKEAEVQVDPTVQEKAITFPTDTKLYKKIIEKCRKIAKVEDIALRQSYRRKLKQLMLAQRNSQHPKRKKKARAAQRKIKTIAGRLVRELERKLPEDIHGWYAEQLTLFKRVLAQQRYDKNKIYSLHAPEVCCIAKGKEHKPYEFGSKVAVVRCAKRGVIVGMTNFNTNIYDGHTLTPALAQAERVRVAVGGDRPKIATVDRGCKGQKQIYGTQICIPAAPTKQATAYQKRKARQQFRRRAGIEPVISHLKHDHRMIRNFLRGVLGDAINALLAACAFNVKKRYNQIRKALKGKARLIFDLMAQRIFLLLINQKLVLQS
jgi:transposase, IS5 family